MFNRPEMRRPGYNPQYTVGSSKSKPAFSNQGGAFNKRVFSANRTAGGVGQNGGKTSAQGQMMMSNAWQSTNQQIQLQ